VKVLVAAIEKAIMDPEVQKTLHDKIGLLTKYRGPKDTTEFLKKQHADVEPLVKKMK
jgi:tripartite-type tricarboxylate transporter receptor subunit TctC